MVKQKLILIALTLFGASGLALANLGDSKETASLRIGAPSNSLGHAAYYRVKEGIVMEWYGKDNLCEVAAYYKLTGEFESDEPDKLAEANLPKSVETDDWIEYRAEMPGVRAWITKDRHYYKEQGHVPLPTLSGTYPAFLVATLPGYEAFVKEFSSLQ